MPNLQDYIFHILEHFTTKLCNFTKFKMLFQDVAMFLPVSIFSKFHLKLKVKGPFKRQYKYVLSVGFEGGDDN